MKTDTNDTRNMSITMILLCIGYFIDFYDLTIFSASYTNLIPDLFHITNTNKIQELYLSITNYYTLGIIIGAIVFGILGDRLGRAYIIRYSILIYSIAILLSVFTHSIIFFTFLRFIAGFGLATEFATSSVLLAELLNTKLAVRSTSWLYFSGILGGITAVYIGSYISWQTMFICGGISGVLLYLFRKNLLESNIFILSLKHRSSGVINYFKMDYFISFIKLLILILPFYFLISVMFILPNFMNISFGLTHAIHLLLIGFFIGNLLSTLCCAPISNYFSDYRIFIWLSIIVFALFLPLFSFINDKLFLAYFIVLGLLGGGLPTIWIQMINKSFPTVIRSTASNTLYAMGRASSIAFNLLLINWIGHKSTFIPHVIFTVIIITAAVTMTLFTMKNNYSKIINRIK